MQRLTAGPGFLAAVLAGLAMLGPFTIDTYLPSFPAIAGEFGAEAAGLQQTLSAYFITFAVMTLFHGALSDSFGRKPVILAGLALYSMASIGCALSSGLSQLILFRAMQGLSAGAGMVVGRAVIRDLFEGHDAQRLMSLVTMIFGIAPAVAPVIGGWLQEWFGWRSIFLFLTAYGLTMLGLCWFRLPESHPPSARQPFTVAMLARNYLRLAGDSRLMLLCAAVAFNFAGFFIYVVSAPAFIYDILGLRETQFAWLFVPGIAGIMFGAFLSGRAAGRISADATIRIGYAVMFSAALYNVTYSFLAVPALPWSVLPVMVYTTGMALAMPSLTLMALELHPAHRGMTASMQGFMQSFLSGVSAGALAPILAGAAVTLALGMTGLLLAGWALWMMYQKIEAGTTGHERT